MKMTSAAMKPFQLLEINIISAQDLEPVTRKMKTYATAWVNPNRKLISRVDKEGHVNPTWNDKFVFRVDDEFLREDTSAVQIEIHCLHWFRDALVGTVRVLVGNLIPPLINGRPHHHNTGMRFVALQVRRASGRPQGILNIGVALLDSSMRSMPLYKQLCASAVGYLDLMAEDRDPNHNHHTTNNLNQDQKNDNQGSSVKPILRRSRSERSERVTFDKVSVASSSIIGIPISKNTNKAVEKDSSILSISIEPPPPVPRFDGNKKKGKASSVISGAELREKPKKGKNMKAGSVISGAELREKPQKGKNGMAGSLLSDSIFSKVREEKSTQVNDVKVEEKKDVAIEKQGSEIDVPTTKKIVNEKSPTVSKGVGTTRPTPKYNLYDYGGPRGNGKAVYGAPFKGSSIWSDSEVGPSPSEVAAAIAEKKYPLDEERSSVLDGWSLNESVEGLRSKLERWRTEVPPIYDNSYNSSSFHSTSQHTRRRSDGGSSGMFTCFGNVYGYECQCVCGKPKSKKRPNARYQSSSVGSRSLF